MAISLEDQSMDPAKVEPQAKSAQPTEPAETPAAPTGFLARMIANEKREGILSSWFLSMLVTVGCLFLMTLLFLEQPPPENLAELDSEMVQEEPEALVEEIIEPLPIEEVVEQMATDEPVAPATSQEVPNPTTEIASLSPVDAVAIDPKMIEAATLNPSGVAAKGDGGAFTSRGSGDRQGNLGGKGGTRHTEFAVNAGLEWLVRHQFDDGHWQFDHTPRATGPTSGAGSLSADIAGTGLGLLPFLGANFTHKNTKREDFRRAVDRSLKYLVSRQRPDGFFLGSGETMYSHGIATIALCEAYGLTADPTLKMPAIKAVEAIIKSQNATGGWRYSPESVDADTSIVGWQVMGLKSAQMASIEVPSSTYEGISRYLDACQFQGSSHLYGYLPGDRVISLPTTSAVGLLARQYMGATRSDEMIRNGVAYLIQQNMPDKKKDPYYWYYATQVVHNYQGPQWDKWNRKMRSIWVQNQNRDKASSDHGSWDPENADVFGKAHGVDRAGRHYVTCMGLLTLEVYYRYLPLYKLFEGEDDLVTDILGADDDDINRPNDDPDSVMPVPEVESNVDPNEGLDKALEDAKKEPDAMPKEKEVPAKDEEPDEPEMEAEDNA